MQPYKKLQEQHEDALFALLMEDVAQREGQQALDEMEALARDRAFSIPSGADRACRKTIRSYYTGSRYRTVRRLSFRILNKVAIIALILILALTTAFAASPTVRRAVLNYVIRIYDDHTDFSFVEEFDQSTSKVKPIEFEVAWIPDGFELMEEYSDEISAWQIYQDSSAREIQISIMRGVNQVASLNSENGSMQEVFVGGQSGYLLTQSDWKILFLIDPKQTLTIEIYTYADSSSTLLPDVQLKEIAEGIIVNLL